MIHKAEVGIIAVFAAVMAGVMLASGCSSSSPQYRVDRAVEAERFDACMKAIPQGPSHLTASSNDWAEVVAMCGRQARSQARVCIANCENGEFL